MGGGIRKGGVGGGVAGREYSSLEKFRCTCCSRQEENDAESGLMVVNGRRKRKRRRGGVGGWLGGSIQA